MSRNQLTLARVFLAVYLLAVAWLCFGHFGSMPDVPRFLLGIPMDKIVHFLMFLPFPFLTYFAFNRFTERLGSSALYVLATFVAGAILAAGTEIAQARLTTWREGDPADFQADLLALGLGSLAILLIIFWKQRK